MWINHVDMFRPNAYPKRSICCNEQLQNIQVADDDLGLEMPICCQGVEQTRRHVVPHKLYIKIVGHHNLLSNLFGPRLKIQWKQRI